MERLLPLGVGLSAIVGIALVAGVVLLAPASAQIGAPVAPDTTCRSANPCLREDNQGTGPGVTGTSTGNNGLVGSTTYASTSSTKFHAGLMATDASTSGFFDVGVFGKSIRGQGVVGQTYRGVGVTGTSTNGVGVAGSSSSNVGVFGSSSSQVGVSGSSSSNAGVVGTSGSSDGVIGLALSTSSDVAGVQGDGLGSSIGVRASGHGGRLFVGNNSNGLDVFTVDDAGSAIAMGGLLGGSSSFPATGVDGQGFEGVEGDGVGTNSIGVSAINEASSGGEALDVLDLSGTGTLIDGFDTSLNLKFQVDDVGNVFAHSFNATLFAQRQATSSGRPVTTYAHQSSMPTLEDFGETQLTDGQAYVPLERTFAAAVDKGAGYLVFITPEGDTRGLYVTQKTPAGFSVRENQGGRATVAFSYRIVAKPYGSTAQRLALAPEMHRALAPPRPRLRTAALRHIPKSKI